MVRPRPNDPCPCGSGKKYKKCHLPRDRIAALHGEAIEDGIRYGSVRPGRITPMRPVPAGIPRPDYAEDGIPKMVRPRNLIKDEEAIAGMRRACAAARRVLEKAKAEVAPGVTTERIDEVAHQAYLDEGGYPSPLNYHGFPKSVCTSINEVICHGIPDSRALADGDIVNIDVTIYLEGYHGDCSETVLVGDVAPETRTLVEATREALYAGIGAVGPGRRIRDIGRAIEKAVKPRGYGIVTEFVGHGIGEIFHMDPQVPHYYDHKSKREILPGMTFTVEPMINAGARGHVLWDDGWTAVTEDLLPSAQFEHTLLVTDRGVEILTIHPEEPQPFPH